MRRVWRGLVLVVLAACAGQEPSSTPLPTRSAEPAPTDVASELLGPLTGLGPCRPPPPAAADVELPDGLLVPPDAVITRVTETGPLTNAQGYVPLTPVQVRLSYAERTDVELITVEDEGIESEILLSTGGQRLFVKASAICEQGSVFAAVLAPESAADAVPVPSGSAAPTPQ